jgi:hypothetical protein
MNNIMMNHDQRFNIMKYDTVTTWSRRIKRCLMWNKWASRLVLCVVMCHAAFASEHKLPIELPSNSF